MSPASRSGWEFLDPGGVWLPGRVFRCYRMARHPAKLWLGFLLIVGLFICGSVMDAARWGHDALPGEFDRYLELSGAEFESWRTERFEQIPAADRTGVFRTLLVLELDLFGRLVSAAVNLRPGFDQLSPHSALNSDSVLGSLRLMIFHLPGWLWRAHPGFLAVFLSIAVALFSLLGGAISRLAMAEAAENRLLNWTEGVRYSWNRWPTFASAPLLPLTGVGLCALGLAVAGLLFSVPGLNVLAAAGYFVAIAVGIVMAVLLIGAVAGFPLLYPALSAEGTDAFDAVARSFSYAFGRPWRLLFYSLIALVYGAATYLFVGLFIFLVMDLTHRSLSGWVDGLSTVLPAPRFGQLLYTVPEDNLGWHEKWAAAILKIESYAFLSLLGAYAISFFFCSYSQIYLILRRLTDGTAETQFFHETAEIPVAEKLEPARPPTPPPAPPAAD